MKPEMNLFASSVLVVDDEAAIRRSLELILTKVGYQVVQASTAEEALHLVADQSFLCAITDLRMPGMGGHGFVRQVHKVKPELPVIVVSGHGDIDDVIECLRHDVADYLVKPCSPAELRAASDRIIEKHERLQQRLGQTSAASATASSPPPPAAWSGTAPPSRPAAQVLERPIATSTGILRKGTLASILERLRSGDIPIPSSSRVALRARTLIEKEKGWAAGVDELLEQDAHLTGRILAMANSPVYSGLVRVTNLRTAVARVGFREVLRIIDTLIAQEFHSVNNPALKSRLQQAWHHSWIRALVMRHLALELQELAPIAEEAYLAGLFADIGVPFLFKVLSELGPVGQEEELLVRQHHGQVGKTILAAWKLSAPSQEVAGGHHPLNGEPPSPLVELLWAAEPLVEELDGGRDIEPISAGAQAQMRLGLSEALLTRVRDAVAIHIQLSQGKSPARAAT